MDDLEAFHQDLKMKGVTCILPPTMQEYGSKLAVYADPDGLPFSVGEKKKES